MAFRPRLAPLCLVATCILFAVSLGQSRADGGRGVSSILPASIVDSAFEFWELIAPGGKLHPAGFIEHRGHLMVEALLFCLILYLIYQPRSSPTGKEPQQLTEKEIDELCEEWEPEPLCPSGSELEELEKPLLVTKVAGLHIEIDGQQLLNMVSTDFLGLSANSDIREVCRSTINKYGVGSCGPRGFYGTVDVHLQLEERISEFMGTEETIIYSYDIATAASILPAFANAKDVIVCDESVHYPIQNGCQLSRAKVVKFKHNDMEDLERQLKKVAAEDKKLRKPLNRRFVVVEAIYHNHGDVCPLDEIYRIKEKYKYRLIVDESLSFGVLGAKGRGACEHFGLAPGDVEIIFASMSNALASVGGFVTGDREVCDHQRLSGLGYCFSASLPPFLATAAQGAVDYVADHADLLGKISQNAAFLRRELATVPGLEICGQHERDSISPVIFVRLKEAGDDGVDQRCRLQMLSDWVRREWLILMIVPIRSPLDWEDWGPAIRLAVTVRHEIDDLKRVVDALRDGVRAVSAQC